MKISITQTWKKGALTIMLLLVEALAIIFAIDLAKNSSTINFIFGIFFALLVPCFLLSLLFQGYFTGFIEIGEKGISFKTNKMYKMKWSDIKYIVATNQSNGKYIGFFGADFQEEFKTTKKYYEYINIPIKMFSENFVYIDYSSEALKEIKKYWGNQIINENDLYNKRKK